MTTISIANNQLLLNNTVILFPASVQLLQGLLGTGRHFKAKANNIFSWDEEGLAAYSKDGVHVEALNIYLQKADLHFLPTSMYSGSFTIEGVDVVSYYATHKDSRIKLFQGDIGGAFVFGDTQLWFDIEKNSIRTLELSVAEPREEIELLEPDPEFDYYKPLWQQWIDAVKSVVPESNRYYNLTHGISAEDLSKVDKTLEIPPALLNFYKVHDVNYDGVASPFSFTNDNIQFDLIPFKDIHDHWTQIQDLAFDEVSPGLLSDYSPKVKADNYANPAWIPFAEERGGDYLLFDTDPSEKGTFGQIIELQNESWSRTVIADSIKELVENQIDTLRKGSNEYFDFLLKNG